VVVTDDRRAAAKQLASERRLAPVLAGAPWLTAEQMLASPQFLIGSVDQIAEELIALRERHGISYFTIRPPEMEAFAPVVARLAGR
jgi:hypothetical protein